MFKNAIFEIKDINMAHDILTFAANVAKTELKKDEKKFIFGNLVNAGNYALQNGHNYIGEQIRNLLKEMF